MLDVNIDNFLKKYLLELYVQSSLVAAAADLVPACTSTLVFCDQVRPWREWYNGRQDEWKKVDDSKPKRQEMSSDE